MMTDLIQALVLEGDRDGVGWGPAFIKTCQAFVHMVGSTPEHAWRHFSKKTGFRLAIKWPDFELHVGPHQVRVVYRREVDKVYRSAVSTTFHFPEQVRSWIETHTGPEKTAKRAVP